MRKINFLLISISLFFVFQIPKTYKKQIKVITPNYPKENPKEKKEWLKSRLIDPSTGEIPQGIRKKEVAFSNNLPNDALNIFGLQFTARGPYNVGGRSRALEIDVNDENVIVAGGASGGIWKSENGGNSWDKMISQNQIHNVTCVTQDKRQGKSNIWYFGTGELDGSSASGGGAYFQGNGIYKSYDNGLTWDSLPYTASNNPQTFDSRFDYVWDIEIDNSIDSLDVIYACTYGNIWRSEDGGYNWNKTLGGNGNHYYTSIKIDSNGTAYGALSSVYSNTIQKGIWRSEDGINWINILPNNFPSVYGRISIDINPLNQNEVYFLCAETTGFGQYTNVFFGGETWTSLWKYTYISGDGSGNGGVWEDLSMNIPANRPTDFDNFNAQGGYDLIIKIKPDEPNTIFIGGTNLWRSTDGFSSDSNTTHIGGYFEGSSIGNGNWGSYENHHPDQHEILFLPSDPKVLINANDGGIFKTLNCKKDTVDWISLNNGYQTTQLYSVTTSRNPGSDIILGGFQDNGNFITMSSNPTDHWTMPLNGDGAFNAISNDEQNYYISIQRGRVFKMNLDANGSVNSYNRIDPIGADTTKYLFINPLIMDASDDNIIYFPEGNRLWRNNDLSNITLNNSNQRISTGWFRFSDSLNSDKITAFGNAVHTGGMSDILYFGTDNGEVYKILDPANSDNPFINITPTNMFPNGYVTDIEVDPENHNKLIVVFSNYNTNSLFYSEDGGISWGNISGNLEEPMPSGFITGAGSGPSCRTAEIVWLNNKKLYIVGTSTGLYATDSLVPYYTAITTSESTNWTQIGKEYIGNVVVENLNLRDSDQFLVVGTHGNGVYSTNITNIDDVLSIEDKNNSFNVFPNPCQDYLIVEKQKDFQEIKEVNIYNIDGKLIKKYFTKYNNNKSIKLNTNNIQSGLYVLEILSEEKREVVKIIIED